MSFKQYSFMVSLIALLICVLLYGIFWLNAHSIQGTSLVNRVKTLEEIMQQKTRPVIHIQRASVYTTRGEIVIEED